MNILIHRIHNTAQRTLTLAAGIAALVLAGCGGGGSGDSTVTPPPPPPVRTPQPVTFLAQEPNLQQRHLFVADDEGGSLDQLTSAFTTTNGMVLSFAVSPDGQTIAYAAIANLANAVDVFVIPSAGGTPVQLSSAFPVETRVLQLAWSPDSSQIAYVANPQGRAARGFAHWEVFLADRDGSNNRKINGSVGSPPTVAVANIKWSPDSRYLAQAVLSLDPFQTTIGLNTFDAELGTPNSTRITPGLDWQNNERLDQRYYWSPDSTRLLIRSQHEIAGTYQIYAAAADGSGASRLNSPLPAGRDVHTMAWSPGGDYVAYWAEATVDSRPDLLTTRLSDSTISLVSEGTPNMNAQITPIKWSPDGSQLLVQAQRDTAGVTELYVADAEGTGILKLHRPLVDGEYAVDGAWSPDGSEIAFRSNLESDQFEAFIVGADGSNLRKVSGAQVAGASGVSLPPIWSPDGSRIVYLGYQADPQTRELYVSTADGLTNNRVNAAITAADVYIESVPTWSADSTRIVFSDRFNDFPTIEALDIWVGTSDGSAPIMLNGSNDYEGQYHY